MDNRFKGSKKQNGLGNFAIADKLYSVRKSIETHNTFSRKLVDMGLDGEDHINIYLDCNTALGKVLSPFNIKPFFHPFFGEFNSRQGLYYYLLSVDGNAAFRTMNPLAMRFYASKRANMNKFYPNLRYHMAFSLWLQVKDDIASKDLLLDNDLPFEAYFNRKYRGDGVITWIPTRPNNIARWVVEIGEVISNAIKNNQAPDLSVFIDDQEALDKLNLKVVSRVVQVQQEPRAKPKFKNPKPAKEVKATTPVESDKTEDHSTQPTADEDQRDVTLENVEAEIAVEFVSAPEQEIGLEEQTNENNAPAEEVAEDTDTSSNLDSDKPVEDEQPLHHHPV